MSDVTCTGPTTPHTPHTPPPPPSPLPPSPRTLSEVQQLQRVAAQNITAVSLLAKLGDAAKAMTVGWDWGLHPHYPGMKLTR